VSPAPGAGVEWTRELQTENIPICKLIRDARKNRALGFDGKGTVIEAQDIVHDFIGTVSERDSSMKIG